jgi:pyruvate,water dikinase
MQPSQYLTWLNGTPVTHEQVGGKAASLSRLAQLGAPVPPAFALTTDAYDEIAHRLGLPTKASQVHDDELEAIRAAITSADLPAHLRKVIEHGYRAINQHAPNGRALAVRSSAIAEDSPEFSFAGLHDTILDVSGLDTLERAIKQCWASLWSERAVVYRRSGDDTLDAATMAVVVQQLIRCDVSFIVFTADPISQNDDHLIISATYGLGEAVVSGLVTPDHIVIDASGEVESYLIGEKEVMIIPGADDGGVRQVPVPRMVRGQQALTHDHAREIGRVARRLECELGYPLDIEGGVAEGKLHLFQVRPITTLSRSQRPRKPDS